MKAKKLVALAMSVALTIGAASLIAACDKPEGENPGGSNTGTYVEDTNTYHCAGTSQGPDANLYEQGWNQTAEGATSKVTFVKKDVENKNVYELQMKMYAGDMFKIVHGGAWTEEITSYYFTNSEEDDTYHYVAKTDGEIIFRDESGSSSNITLTEGHDGIYKFTLETDPSATDLKAKYKLTYELVQSIDRLKIPYKMALMGDINNFNTLNPYTMTNDNGVWSAMIEITADDLGYSATGEEVATGATHSAIYVVNTGDGTGEANEKMAFVDETLDTVDITVGGKTVKVNLLTEGKWTISFSQETKTVSITKFAYEIYFIGSFCGWAANEGYKEYPLTPALDGTWSGVLTLTEDAEVQLYNAKGANDSDKYIPGNNYNLTAGTWVFKYDPETKEVKYEAQKNYYLTGSFSGWGDGPVNGQAVKLNATETAGVYTADIDWTELTGEIEFKVVEANFVQGIYDNVWHGDPNNDWNNYKIAAGKKYHVTLTEVADNAPTVVLEEITE